MPAPRTAPPSDLAVLFGELVRLETELWDAVAARLRADHGLPLPQFEFMQVISRVPGCRVRDIAAALAITVGGASKIVDRLEAAGLCDRRAHPGDRRSSIIELTPAGRRLLAAATVTFEQELGRLIGSALPERALRPLTATLSRLRGALRATAVGPASGTDAVAASGTAAGTAVGTAAGADAGLGVLRPHFPAGQNGGIRS